MTQPQYGISSRRRLRGFTMVEMGVALAVLGIVSVAFVAYWRLSGQQRVAVVERDLMVSAQQAMLGFVHANHRLPCPAVDDQGVENCDGARQVGQLPWRTLQLSSAASARMRYGVYRSAQPNLRLDMDLAALKLPAPNSPDRMWPLMTDVSADVTTAIERSLGQSNLPDLCLALSLGSKAAPSTTALAVADATAAPAALRPMAYVIAAPGLLDADADGDRFDGRNRTATSAAPTFEAGNRPVSSAYDDRVLAMGFDTLFANLQCGQALSAMQHSHANAALSASVMKRAISDYHYQLQVEAVLAGANLASATAGVSLAAAGLANAVAALANATAFTVISYGTAAGLIAAATAAVVVNTAAVVASAAPLALAIAVTVESAKRVEEAADMMPPSAALATDVNANARIADALGH